MRIRLAMATASVMALMVATPAWAGTGSATAGSLTVTLTVDDVMFNGPGCQYASYRVDFSGPGAVEFEASQQGSSNSLGGGRASRFEPGTEIEDEGLFICPNLDGAGTYFIRGTVEEWEGNEASAPLPSDLSFVVSVAPAKVSGLRAKQAGNKLRISGRATAVSDRGNIGVQGGIKLQGRLSKKAGGKGKWTTIGTVYPDQFGKFKYVGSTSQRLKGAQIRAILAPSSWASAAEASTRVK